MSKKLKRIDTYVIDSLGITTQVKASKIRSNIKKIIKKDELKLIKSSWKKDLEIQYESPKMYNFSLIGGYFYQDINFG